MEQPKLFSAEFGLYRRRGVKRKVEEDHEKGRRVKIVRFERW